MRTLFLLNPTAGKADCTRTLPQQINAAAARAGLAPEEYAIQVTNHAGHARELANAAAQQARQSGEELRVFTAGGDGTFNEALTGIYGYANAAVGCLPFGSGNDFLRTFGGHIGYSVRPSERRKGYASWMLKNVQPYCKSLGLSEILVCCLDTNEGSRRTILKNGGRFDGTAYRADENKTLERYWITL